MLINIRKDVKSEVEVFIQRPPSIIKITKINENNGKRGRRKNKCSSEARDNKINDKGP